MPPLVRAAFGLVALLVAAVTVSAQMWLKGAPMVFNRENHVAVLLADDRTVLVVGGTMLRPYVPPWVWGPYLDVCGGLPEVYDYITGNWTKTNGSMVHERSVGHTATLLNDGTVFIYGSTVCQNSFDPPAGPEDAFYAELFHPSNGSFTQVPHRSSLTDLTKCRFLHTATLLHDGRVFIAGGRDCGSSYYSASSAAEIFDPVTGNFTALPSMPFGRCSHTAALLPNGDIVIAGGTSGVLPMSNGIVAMAETRALIFTVYNQAWSVLSSPELPFHCPLAVAFPDSRVLMVYNDTAQFLNHRSWEIMPGPVLPLITPMDPYNFNVLQGQRMVLLADGRSILSTGDCAVNCTALYPGAPIPRAGIFTFDDVYVPTAGSWRYTANMNWYHRSGHSLTLLPNGRVLAAGGFDSPDCLSELYDATLQPTQPPTQPQPQPQSLQPYEVALISIAAITIAVATAATVLFFVRYRGRRAQHEVVEDNEAAPLVTESNPQTQYT